jgi:hypothetical protein
VHRVILFDVEHGFCAFAKSPTGCSVMIDCGRRSDFSPVHYILENELDGMAFRNRYRLTKLIITHPHDDHIEDISNVMNYLEPSILQRQQYDWEAIKDPKASRDEYENLDAYAGWQKTYSCAVTEEPNWGMKIDTFCLKPSEAYQLDKTKYVNNSSIATLFTIKGTEYTQKLLFGADVEQAGWTELLKRPTFREAIRGVVIYVAPHHGHTSGFSADLFYAMGGKPVVNIISVHSRDESVDSRYSSQDFASGFEFGGETRYMLSTRADGSIFFDVFPSGKISISTVELSPNIE